YSDIEFIYLNGEDLTTEELISTLKNLKQGTIVLCFVWFRDKTGRYFSLEHMGSKIIGSCAVPFFPLNYFWMKYGAVGGKLNSGTSHGTKAADIASKIMLGTHKPKDFPIQQCRNKYIFDYNQLRKWNFNMSLLPEGSIIINRHLSFFQRHKIFTISILLFVILQTLVIIAFISNFIMRKKAEHEKTSSQKRCRNLIETINDWVWETNSDLKYTFSSSTVEQILGYAPEEIIGKTPLDIIVPEEHDRISAFLNKTIKEKKPFNMLESTNFHKDGHKVILERSGVPIFDEKNKFMGFRGIDRDISYKKKIEKEREYLLYDLSIKNEDLENIVYIASHDLRSPLVNIQGFSNELCEIFTECFGKINQMDIPITQKQEITKKFETFVKPSFEFIRKNILKMDKLLASLLKLAKIGNAAMEITAINMNELMDSIFSAMQYQIKTAKIKIEKNSLPDCMGDCIQINQIFSNLIDNAIKYTDPNKQGRIIVTAKRNNSKIIYCIKDNGIGIDPLYHLKVFDIFQRLDPNNQIDGIGIGLTIVKRIVERNNGKIWIDSKAGQGCKVFVELPSAS
ncbi:PAS domain S-box protein, partial [bacterium]|nr:PAS domain S-box protein [bacterium]